MGSAIAVWLWGRHLLGAPPIEAATGPLLVLFFVLWGAGLFVAVLFLWAVRQLPTQDAIFLAIAGLLFSAYGFSKVDTASSWVGAIIPFLLLIDVGIWVRLAGSRLWKARKTES